MKTKAYEREQILGNIVASIILAVIILAAYFMFSANPREILQGVQERREAAMWNAELSEVIDEGDAEAAITMANNSVYELSEENAQTIQMWKEMITQEEELIADMLEEVRNIYLAGGMEEAEEKLISLCVAYPDSAYVKAYAELLASVEKTLSAEDMYDWKYGGKPGYGTYKDYRGNEITGFCFRSHYTSNGEYGYFDTKSYTQISVEADCIAMGSETLPITITDMNTGNSHTIYCPKGSVHGCMEITGGDIQISTPDDSKYAYGSAVIQIKVTKELTETDFETIDVRFQKGE